MLYKVKTFYITTYKCIYSEIKMGKKTMAVRLEEEEITFLREYGRGRISDAVRELIAEKKRRMEEGEARQKAPDERLEESIIVPSDSHLKDTYLAIVRAFIANGGRAGSIDYFLSKIMGDTGYDSTTALKHVRKLGSSRYIKFISGATFRPTFRLVEGVTIEQFRELISDYSDFIRQKRRYADVWIDAIGGAGENDTGESD